MVTEKDIRNVLESTIHPEVDRSLVELAMIRKIESEGNTFIVFLALPFLTVPIREILITKIKDEIKDKLGINVEVKVVEMSPEEKAVFGKTIKEVRGIGITDKK